MGLAREALKIIAPACVKSGARALEWKWREATAAYRALPDFIIIGAQRCGTTSLYNYLLQHPRVLPAFHKEVHYFDLHFHEGVAWYRSHFPLCEHLPLARKLSRAAYKSGEASPYYIFHPLAPRRVATLLPRCKLIALLRNPVDRAYSHYHHQVRMGHETLTFEEAIDAERERLEGETERLMDDETYRSHSYQYYSYLTRGEYAKQLERWMEYFPREQILVLASEELFASPREVVWKVFKFLDLRSFRIRCTSNINPASYPPMSPAARARLVEYFMPHNHRLYSLLGADFGWDRK